MSMNIRDLAPLNHIIKTSDFWGIYDIVDKQFVAGHNKNFYSTKGAATQGRDRLIELMAQRQADLYNPWVSVHDTPEAYNEWAKRIVEARKEFEKLYKERYIIKQF